MPDDETAQAQADFDAIQQAVEELRPRYEMVLSTEPLNNFDPVSAMSAEDIQVSQRWQELNADADKARARLEALRDA